NPDGSPAREGFVYLIPAGDRLTLRNGGVDQRLPETIHARVAPGGRFSLPPERPGFLLLALADTGFAVVGQRDLPPDKAIPPRPWARVTGMVKIGTKLAADLAMSVRREAPELLPNEGDPIVFGHPGGCDVVSYDIATDAEGRFQLPRVVPGHYEFMRVV